MGMVVAQASMSLDSYIAKADNSIGRLFDWYEAGDVELTTAKPGLTSTSRRPAAGTIAAQCLQLKLLDVVAIDLVPVVMGGGRAFFPGLPIEDVPLGDPEVCVPSARVTHLRMPVIR